jgi:pimeloyl-ACP methyl ester carboxylesterase
MLASIVGVLALALGALFVGQRSLIYFPDSVTHDQLARMVEAEFGEAAHLLPDFDAIVVTPGDREPLGTAIVFHGNAGLNVHRAPLARELAARGLRVVLAEYPGYGSREGSPSERLIVEDALALYREVARRYPREPVALVGESLGSGVAAQVAAAPGLSPSPSRLVLLTPFVSIPDTAARPYPVLPVRALVRDRFDTAAALAKFDGPVTILVAGQDEVLGPEPARRLAAIARNRGPTDVVELERAGHNDWWGHATAETWDRIAGASPYPTVGSASP